MMNEKDSEMIKKIEAENKNSPHPKNNEELKKILAETKEIGGPVEGTTEFGDWSVKGRVSDF